MVYTERTEKHISPQDQNSKDTGKSAATSKYCLPNGSCSSNSSSKSGSSSSWSKQAPPEDKWKYNHMVRENRDKFNSMHHC